MEFTTEEFNKFKTLVIMQLSKYNIKGFDYDDYIQEAFLYVFRRKGKIDLTDRYIYGDISNGVNNYLKKELNYRYNVKLNPDENLDHLIELNIENTNAITIRDIMEYEYGYLLLLNRVYGYSGDELSIMFNLHKNKIYLEINKIIDELKGVYI